MGRLLEVLENVDLGNPECHDESVWCLEEENGFLVRSMYHALCVRGDSSNPGPSV